MCMHIHSNKINVQFDTTHNCMVQGFNLGRLWCFARANTFSYSKYIIIYCIVNLSFICVAYELGSRLGVEVVVKNSPGSLRVHGAIN